MRVLASRDGDASFFRRVDAGYDFDEGGFPRAVFAGQAVDFSGRDLQVDVDQGSHAGKGFTDVSYRQHRGVHVVSFPIRICAPRPLAPVERSRRLACARVVGQARGPATASSMMTRPWRPGGRVRCVG